MDEKKQREQEAAQKKREMEARQREEEAKRAPAQQREEEPAAVDPPAVEESPVPPMRNVAPPDEKHHVYNMAHVKKREKQIREGKAPRANWLPDTGALDWMGAFDTAKFGKSVAVAKRHAELRRIVKKEIVSDPNSTPYRMGGKPLKVTQFTMKDTTQTLGDYGCPTAVYLYLRFHMEMGLLFLAMFVIAIPDLVSNILRTTTRQACRAFTYESTSYTSASPYPLFLMGGADAAACGWTNLPIRQNLSSPPSYLYPGLGACQEYSAASDAMLPLAASAQGLPPVYQPTPQAEYCNRGSSGLANAQYWLQFLNSLVFFLFLIRIRRMQRSAAKLVDRSQWTASDYTVLVKGLDRNVVADGEEGLESRVYKDLESMGFKREQIAQVEVARECREEMADIYKMYEIKVREQEAKARKSSKQLEKVRQDKAEVMASLEAHKQEADMTTGHAFVVFLYERDRNALLERCKVPSLVTRLCSGDERPDWTNAMARTQSSTPGKKPRVEVAPEPDDVLWPNLSINDQEARTQQLKTTAVTILLLLIGMGCNIGAKVWKAQISANPTDAAAAFPLPPNLSDEEREAYLNYYTVSMSMLNALIPVAVNMIIRLAVDKMINTEGHDTATDRETSIFGKLSLAYVLNSAIIPIGTGMVYSLIVSDRPVNQSWYESGGVVNEAFMLMLSNALITDALKLVQIATLFSRYCLARCVVSHEKFEKMWAPPDMNLGELYAASLRTCALCLLYAPLWPPAYALTAFAMAITFFCTKCAVATWYKKPPMVSEDMMEKMRARLAFTMLLHNVVAAIGANAAADDAAATTGTLSFGTAASTPIILMFLLWVAYEFLDAPGCLKRLPGLGDYSGDDVDDKYKNAGEEAADIPYRTITDPATGKTIPGVEDTIGCLIDEYICPTAREDDRYTISDLIDIVLRDFSEDPNDEEAGNATMEDRRPMHKAFGKGDQAFKGNKLNMADRKKAAAAASASYEAPYPEKRV